MDPTGQMWWVDVQSRRKKDGPRTAYNYVYCIKISFPGIYFTKILSTTLPSQRTICRTPFLFDQCLIQSLNGNQLRTKMYLNISPFKYEWNWVLIYLVCWSIRERMHHFSRSLMIPVLPTESAFRSETKPHSSEMKTNLHFLFDQYMSIGKSNSIN